MNVALQKLKREREEKRAKVECIKPSTSTIIEKNAAPVITEKSTKTALKQTTFPDTQPRVKMQSRPMSMVGTDPKQSVVFKSASNQASTSFNSYRIPKKKPSPSPDGNAMPTKNSISLEVKPRVSTVPQKQPTERKKEAPSSTSEDSTANRPIQWQAAKDRIQERECNLPDTLFSLTATLNIPPAQLTSYGPLSIESAPITIDKITQETFNDAVTSNKISVVKAALRNKAHGLDLDSPDARGRTLLHRLADVACDQQHTQDEIIDCLVNAGASMTIVDKEHSRTPLHASVYSRRLCHVRKFVQLGSPINIADGKEETPLISALRTNNVEIAQFLLSSGATYQAAFSAKLNLTKSQQKPVTAYQNMLQDCMKKARQLVIP